MARALAHVRSTQTSIGDRAIRRKGERGVIADGTHAGSVSAGRPRNRCRKNSSSARASRLETTARHMAPMASPLAEHPMHVAMTLDVIASCATVGAAASVAWWSMPELVASG